MKRMKTTTLTIITLTTAFAFVGTYFLNLTADNLYASDPSKDRGDYDTNSGLYRLDEMGQKWNSRSKQYGGNIYQDDTMVEGDEVDMTEEEIAEFIANGGELEYL